MTPLFYQGHFTHPDLWQMWFSFFVAVIVTLRGLYKFVQSHLFQELVELWPVWIIFGLLLYALWSAWPN